MVNKIGKIYHAFSRCWFVVLAILAHFSAGLSAGPGYSNTAGAGQISFQSSWTAWSSWSECRDSQRVRIRGCYTVAGAVCIGPNVDTTPCASAPSYGGALTPYSSGGGGNLPLAAPAIYPTQQSNIQSASYSQPSGVPQYGPSNPPSQYGNNPSAPYSPPSGIPQYGPPNPPSQYGKSPVAVVAQQPASEPPPPTLSPEQLATLGQALASAYAQTPSPLSNAYNSPAPYAPPASVPTLQYANSNTKPSNYQPGPPAVQPIPSGNSYGSPSVPTSNYNQRPPAPPTAQPPNANSGQYGPPRTATQYAAPSPPAAQPNSNQYGSSASPTGQYAQPAPPAVQQYGASSVVNYGSSPAINQYAQPSPPTALPPSSGQYGTSSVANNDYSGRTYSRSDGYGRGIGSPQQPTSGSQGTYPSSAPSNKYQTPAVRPAYPSPAPSYVAPQSPPNPAPTPVNYNPAPRPPSYTPPVQQGGYGATNPSSGQYGPPSPPAAQPNSNQYGSSANPTGQYGQYQQPKAPELIGQNPLLPAQLWYQELVAPFQPAGASNGNYGSPTVPTSYNAAPSSPNANYGSPTVPTSYNAAPSSPNANYAPQTPTVPKGPLPPSIRPPQAAPVVTVPKVQSNAYNPSGRPSAQPPAPPSGQPLQSAYGTSVPASQSQPTYGATVPASQPRPTYGVSVPASPSPQSYSNQQLPQPYQLPAPIAQSYGQVVPSSYVPQPTPLLSPPTIARQVIPLGSPGQIVESLGKLGIAPPASPTLPELNFTNSAGVIINGQYFGPPGAGGFAPPGTSAGGYGAPLAQGPQGYQQPQPNYQSQPSPVNSYVPATPSVPSAGGSYGAPAEDHHYQPAQANNKYASSYGWWSQWSAWAPCSCSTQSRTRSCEYDTGGFYSLGCIGASYEFQACNGGSCNTTSPPATSSGQNYGSNAQQGYGSINLPPIPPQIQGYLQGISGTGASYGGSNANPAVPSYGNTATPYGINPPAVTPQGYGNTPAPYSPTAPPAAQNYGNTPAPYSPSAPPAAQNYGTPAPYSPSAPPAAQNYGNTPPPSSYSSGPATYQNSPPAPSNYGGVASPQNYGQPTIGGGYGAATSPQPILPQPPSPSIFISFSSPQNAISTQLQHSYGVKRRRALDAALPRTSVEEQKREDRDKLETSGRYFGSLRFDDMLAALNFRIR